MPAKKLPPAPTFEKAYSKTNGYQVSTPYGIVSIAESGRRITFQLWHDVRESMHDKALFSYYQILRRRGIVQINLDHLEIPGLDRRLPLKRGRAILDLVYTHRGRLYEVELKTHREVGLDITARQIEELATHCENLTLVVPRRDTEDMHTILTMMGLDKLISLDTFELLEDEGQHHEAGR